MQNRNDMTAGVILILLGIAVIFWSIRLKLGTLLEPLSGFFPFVVGAGIVVLAGMLVFQGWWGKGDKPTPFAQWRKPTLMMAALFLYAIILDPLGYVLSTIYIAAFTIRIMGIMSWKIIALGSTCLSLSGYYLFKYALSVELPTGILTILG